MASEPPYKRAGFDTPYAYSKARAEARQWSDLHSRRESSAYDSQRLRDPENFRRYYDAFVSDTTSTLARKKRGGKTSYRTLNEWFNNNPDIMDDDGQPYDDNPYRQLD